MQKYLRSAISTIAELSRRHNRLSQDTWHPLWQSFRAALAAQISLHRQKIQAFAM
jgi:hypothetical protein